MENGKISQSAIVKIVGVDKSTVSVCPGNATRANRVSAAVRRAFCRRLGKDA